LLTAQPLAIDAQGIAFESQQTGDCRTTDFEFPSQLARQFTDRLARPFESRNRIACRGIFEQLI